MVGGVDGGVAGADGSEVVGCVGVTGGIVALLDGVLLFVTLLDEVLDGAGERGWGGVTPQPARRAPATSSVSARARFRPAPTLRP